jgi:hypothetical protein
MRTIQKRGLEVAVVGLSLLAGTTVALADEGEEDTGTGITVTAGGGFEDYVGHTMRHTSNGTGAWAIRTAVELQQYVTLEAGYIGSAAKVNAPLGNEAATLVGTTFEAIGRLTPLPDEGIRPYAFFGAAWRRYDVSGADLTTADSGMNDSDDLFQIPFGAGVESRYQSYVADLRVTFRPSTAEDLVLESDNEYASMNSWGINAAFGYEF